MKKLNLTIPEPCHEDWKKMTPTELGKFCSSCEKEVFDFTTFSDEQLVKHLGIKDHVCGRFTDRQLNRDLQLQRKQRHNYLSYTFSGLFSLFLLNSSTTKAQEKPKTIQTDKKFTSIPLRNTIENDSITISGTVFGENKTPLKDAIVLIKNTTKSTLTDINGKFNLECIKNDVIVFKYVGYSDYEITTNSKNNVIHLKVDNSLDKINIVTGGILRKEYRDINITGTVLNEINSPLQGAIVTVKRTSTSTSTDFNGDFNLKCNLYDILVFNYVGYSTYEIPVSLKNYRNPLTISLNPDSSLGGVTVKRLSKKRWIGGNLFTRFTNIFRKNNRNPNYRF
jgi:protocatechuate 3,4-dioxygenase beta subunit